MNPSISLITTVYNERETLLSTIESVRKNTSDIEIIVVDDASTDGSGADNGADHVIRNEKRRGIAPSRLEGCKHAKGKVLAFLDAHQSVTEGCINQCAELALQLQAIVFPCTRGPVDRLWKKKRPSDGTWTGHGANLVHQESGLFRGSWKNHPPKDRLSRATMCVVPGYVIPRSIFRKVRWCDGQAHWGAGEPTMSLKAFFADVDMVHLCGPIARHKFRETIRDDKGRKKKIIRPFCAPFSQTWRNHAIVCRICADDETWRNYWMPKLYRKWTKGDEAIEAEFDSPEIVAQHKEFQEYKKRPDVELWRGLMIQPPWPNFNEMENK